MKLNTRRTTVLFAVCKTAARDRYGITSVFVLMKELPLTEKQIRRTLSQLEKMELVWYRPKWNAWGVVGGLPRKQTKEREYLRS